MHVNQNTLHKPNFLLLVLCVSAFLAPILGGQVDISALPLISFWESLHSAELSYTAHLLIALPILLVFGLSLAREKVLTYCSKRMLICISWAGIFTLAGVLATSFKWESLGAAAEWSVYVAAFMATLFVTGRTSGPHMILRAFAAGGTMLAIIGVLEYGGMRNVDASWRILAWWTQQNALAGMFTLTIFATLACLIQAQDRTLRLVLGIGMCLQLFALALTQSKGGLLACALGFGVLLVVCSAWKSIGKLWIGLIPLGIAILMVVGLSATTPKGQKGITNRVENASAQKEQSFGFRKLIWKSCIEITGKHPMGTGIGTFAEYCSEPGIVPPTRFGHSTPLQLMSEIGIVGALAAAAGFLLWLFEVFRGACSIPAEKNVTRAIIAAALIASVAHGFLDSIHYHFGVGIAFAMMAAVGLLLSADGATTEPTRGAFRKPISILVTVAIFGMLGYHAISQYQLASARSQPDLESFKLGVVSATNFAPMNGDAQLLLAQSMAKLGDPESRNQFELAIQIAPSLRALRAAARFEIQNGNMQAGEGYYQRALLLDPKNLTTLSDLVEHYKTLKNNATLKRFAERLIAVEPTPYFQVRAIPEKIPTEIADARRALAEIETNPETKTSLLSKAYATYREYATITVREVMHMAGAAGDLGFAGERVSDAKRKLEIGEEMRKQLIETYRSSGDLGRVSDLESDVELFGGSPLLKQ
jgi:hypothetical protein